MPRTRRPLSEADLSHKPLETRIGPKSVEHRLRPQPDELRRVDMIDRAQPRARLYALFLPGATMHACPDGSDKHDHILSAVPGSPGYATQFGLLEVWPGPNFDPSIVPIKSEADLFAAEAAGQVVIIDDEVALHAVVNGPSK